MGISQAEVKEEAAPAAGEAAVDTAEETVAPASAPSQENRIADLEDQVRDLTYRMRRAGSLLQGE